MATSSWLSKQEPFGTRTKVEGQGTTQDSHQVQQGQVEPKLGCATIVGKTTISLWIAHMRERKTMVEDQFSINNDPFRLPLVNALVNYDRLMHT